MDTYSMNVGHAVPGDCDRKPISISGSEDEIRDRTWRSGPSCVKLWQAEVNLSAGTRVSNPGLHVGRREQPLKITTHENGAKILAVSAGSGGIFCRKQVLVYSSLEGLPCGEPQACASSLGSTDTQL